MKRFLSIILTIVVLAGMTVPVMAAEAGSLESWGFEKNNGVDGEVVLDNSVVHSGKAAAKITRKIPQKSNVYSMLKQSVAVEEGKTYKYGFWAKAQAINSVSTLIDWGARTALDPIKNTYDWTYFSFTYTHNKPSGNVRFGIIFDAPIHSFWVDDLEFCEYTDGVKGKNLFKNPGFEGNAAQEITSGSASDSDEFTLEAYESSIATAKDIPVWKNKNINIDGDISDWEGMTSIKLPEDEYHVAMIEKGKTVSSEVEHRFAYDETYLYFLSIVEDDVHFAIEGSDYWKGDGLQFVLSARDRSFGAEFGCAWSEAGGAMYALDFGTGEMDVIKRSVKRDGSKCVYELAIPWELYYGEFMQSIKFCAIYNDNDNDSRKYAWQMSPGIVFEKSNQQYPTLHMIPEGTDYFGWVEGEPQVTVFEDNIYNVCIVNTANEKKVYSVTIDGETKEMEIPALSGKKLPVVLNFESVGDVEKEILMSDGETDLPYLLTTQVIATPDYYDAELEVLQGKIDELWGLIEKCREKNISVDYELPAVRLLEKFKLQIKREAEEQVYDRMTYYFSTLETEYLNAKANLEEYLSGEKTAIAVPRFTTGNVDIVGQTHWANTIVDSTGEEEYRPVFFAGYGHFEEAWEDAHLFSDFGMNCVQWAGNALSIFNIIKPKGNSVPYYGVEAGNSYPVSYEVIKDKQLAYSGSHVLKVSSTTPKQSNRYSRFYQRIPVEPNTTYEFGAMVKSNGTGETWFHGFEWPSDKERHRINGTYDWKEVTFEFTTTATQTSTYFGFTTDDICELYVDNLFMRKKGTKENLVTNSGFEDGKVKHVPSNFEEGLEYTVNLYLLEQLDENLKKFDEENIAVSVLPSLHYYYYPDKYQMAADDPTAKVGWHSLRNEYAKEMIELFIKESCAIINKHPCVTNINYTNEPTFDTAKQADYYQPLFAEFLEERYEGNLERLNNSYGTNYASFAEIPLHTNGTAPGAHLRDWREFNDSVTKEWNEWVTGIYRQYTDLPLHSKIMSTNFEDDSALRVHLRYGSNYENYATWSDVNGCDAFNYYSMVKQPQKLGYNTNPTTTDALEKYQWYDMLVGNMFRPVYNGEDHVTTDSNKDYSPNQAKHVSTDNWQSPFHGRGFTALWTWVTHHVDDATDGHFGRRPDVIAAVSKSALDQNRLSWEIADVADRNPDVGILVSDISRCFNNTYENAVYKAYEASLYTGVKTGYVTDTDVHKAFMHDVMIVPYCTNVKPYVLETLVRYAKTDGKKLILIGKESLAKNDFGEPQEQALLDELYANATVINAVADVFKLTEPKDLKKQLTAIYDEMGLRHVQIKYAETGNDADMIEYMYSIHDGKLLLNICLMDWTNDQDVKIYVNGQQVTKALELRSMKEIDVSTLRVNTHEPIFLQIDTDYDFEDKDIKMQIDNSVMIVDNDRVPVDAESDLTTPVIRDGRTLLPVRALTEAVGGEVKWDGDTRTVTCINGGTEIKMVIDDTTAYVNGEAKTLDVAPQIMNDRTMLPLRFVAENFGLNVSWDGEGRIVTVTK